MIEYYDLSTGSVVDPYDAQGVLKQNIGFREVEQPLPELSDEDIQKLWDKANSVMHLVRLAIAADRELRGVNK